MTLQNKFNHAKKVAKWKIDQTSKILNLQNKMSSISGKIEAKKKNLADETYKLFLDSGIENQKLNSVCQEIKELFTQLEETRIEVEAAKAESPPVLEEIGLSANLSGLVCPECGLELVGNFCPEHGVEGVLPEAIEYPDFIESESIPEGSIVCPKCKKVLEGKFCPEHGVAGVPVVHKKEKEANTTKFEDETENMNLDEEKIHENPVMVCPQCGNELEGEFCPEHGLKGVLK